MDFGVDQIDIKKKLIKKFGENVTIRVRFTPETCPPPVFKEISKNEMKNTTITPTTTPPPPITATGSNGDYIAVNQVELVVREDTSGTSATENI